MKGRPILLSVLALGLMLTLAAGLSLAQGPGPQGDTGVQAAPVSTSFTYQGRLNDGGIAANGTYDFEFKLYDAAASGTQVGSTVTKGDVAVSDGLFTVGLDFGSGIFTGDARWLEIGVRQDISTGAYTTLTPRQALTATPYAFYALSADLLDGQHASAFASVTHSHAGETWTGNNPLTISGSFGDAPLVLSNEHSGGPAGSMQLGDGIRVHSAGDDGVQVDSAGDEGVLVQAAGHDGVLVESAGRDGFSVVQAGGDGLFVRTAGDDGVDVRTAADDGVFVEKAGNPSTTQTSSFKNGFEVSGAQGNGLYVGQADWSGVDVYRAIYHGLDVTFAGTDGVHINSANDDGVDVRNASANGVYISDAGADGVYVRSVGSPPTPFQSLAKNGFEVAGAEGYGLFVGRVGTDGMYVYSAGEDGVEVGTAGRDGMYVGSAGRHGAVYYNNTRDGVYIKSAGEDGVYVESVGNPTAARASPANNGFEVAGARGHGLWVGRSDDSGVMVWDAGNDGVDVISARNYAGYFAGNVRITGTCTGCAIAAFGVNAGQTALEPGDIVAIRGVTQSDLYGTPVVMDLALAASPDAVIGVVAGRAELDKHDIGMESEVETIERLVPREGPAQPGEYVSIIIYGATQVKASAGAAPIQPGTRLTAADRPGHARAVQTVEVHGVRVAESAPVIGVALEKLESGQGLIWVLVNSH